METIISTIVIIACTYFFTRRKVKPIEQETDSGTQPEASADILQEEKQEEPPHTKDLCIELLKQLNCEVFVSEEEENRLDFKYQGEHFIIDATNESFFINIWDPGWYVVPLDDLEQMSNVRKAVNTINNYSGTTIVYYIEEEGQKFILHSKRQCILPKDLPHVKEYLRALLDDFFAVQKWLSKEIATQNKEN
ncbi:hypothetical protein ACQRC7_04875 [Segatella copri]|uniref:hypothetical protein n=1 Tax=Segatella copri TaxID=165179 RepID=UPI003D04AC1C